MRAYEIMYGLRFTTNEKGLTAIAPGETGNGNPVPRLYVTAFSRKFLSFAVRILPIFGQDPRKFGRNKDIDLVQISSWFVPVTTTVNVKPFLPYKERASACHLSQRPPTQQGNFVARLAFRRAQHLETFSRLYPPVSRGERPEVDLFA